MVVQGAVLVLLAILEAASVDSGRVSLAVSTAFFFGAYGVVVLVGGLALWRGAAWARGPMLITQLIMLGLAWNLRDQIAVALTLSAVALVALMGVLHPDTIEALSRETPTDGDPDEGQASVSND